MEIAVYIPQHLNNYDVYPFVGKDCGPFIYALHVWESINID